LQLEPRSPAELGCDINSYMTGAFHVTEGELVCRPTNEQSIS